MILELEVVGKEARARRVGRVWELASDDMSRMIACSRRGAPSLPVVLVWGADARVRWEVAHFY